MKMNMLRLPIKNTFRRFNNENMIPIFRVGRKINN